MNAIFLPLVSTSLPTMDHTGWRKEFLKAEAEDVNNKGGMEAGAPPPSPCHQYKQRRLTCLLDRLSDQIRTNNQYVNPGWLVFEPPAEPREDVPLDLSMKAQPQVKHAVEGKNAFSCSTCSQTFSVHDRLAKHIASRHRNRTPNAQRQYECGICERRFVRSDMLTRHARLHSGVKPYACRVCGQEFSRSDHLVTHQRTHTGEKPYRCTVCPYAACRRDMITRHMRTHAKNENQLSLTKS